MKNTTITILALFALSACGTEFDDGAIESASNSVLGQDIRNGTLANGREYQGIGMIPPTATRGMCTAALVSKSVIITAAQCLRNANLDDIQFTVGATKTRNNLQPSVPKTAKAMTLVPHPGFSTIEGLNLAYDVGLVRLDRAETRRWANLPRYNVAVADMPVDVNAVGVGFGESAEQTAGLRLMGNFLVNSYMGAQGTFGSFIPNAFIEVWPGTEADQMICPGDSGGPLFYNGEIAGVASFRFVAKCPEPGAGYHVSAPRFIPWITATLNELDPPGACATEDSAEFATTAGGCQDVAGGLVWSQPGTTALSQPDAVAYCDNLTEGGKDDWRLATNRELRMLDDLLWPFVQDETDHGHDHGDGNEHHCNWHGWHRQFNPNPAVEVHGNVWSSTTNGWYHAFMHNFTWHKSWNHRTWELAVPLCVRSDSSTL